MTSDGPCFGSTDDREPNKPDIDSDCESAGAGRANTNASDAIIKFTCDALPVGTLFMAILPLRTN
jgi:hypothetical protein